MNIPLVNLARQYQTLKPEIDAAVGKVLTRGDFILGRAVAEFEKSFASYIGVKYCVGLASGTDAIKLALQVSGVGPGDEVITQVNTFIASVAPILELGAKPILVDVDESSGSIDLAEVQKYFHKRTKAILPVHLYGYPVDIPTLVKLIKQTSPATILIEDAAQAHGSLIGKRKAGSFGRLSAFSFYPGKNLGAYGDAGALVTNEQKIARRLTLLRNHGQEHKYQHVALGMNSRLDTIQAAVLAVKLKYLDRWNKARQRLAKLYCQELAGVGDVILPPTPPPGYRTNWHVFAIRSRRRDRLNSYLAKHGVHCGIHYPIPLHLQPCLAILGYRKGSFPHAEQRARTLLSLPMFAELTDQEMEYITGHIRKFFQQP